MENFEERKISHVTFEEDCFTIKIYTGANPVEEWENIIRGLLRLMSNEDVNQHYLNSYSFAVCGLLEAMIPNWETIKRMQHQ